MPPNQSNSETPKQSLQPRPAIRLLPPEFFYTLMATSTQQKQELFKAIWAIAEDLRNSVDGWDFKSYVLGILFYRFISENITNYVNRMQHEAGVLP